MEGGGENIKSSVAVSFLENLSHLDYRSPRIEQGQRTKDSYCLTQ